MPDVNAIAEIPKRKLTKRQLEQISSFTDPGSILATLQKEKWTIQKSIKLLVRIAEGTTETVSELDGGKIETQVKTSVQLNAIKYLNQLVIDAMERSGLMIMATRRFVGDDGEEVRFSGHVVSSVLQSQEEHTTPEEMDRGRQRRTETEEKEKENGQDSTAKPKRTKEPKKTEVARKSKARKVEVAGGSSSRKKEPPKTTDISDTDREDSLSSSRYPTGEQAGEEHFPGIATGQGNPNSSGGGSFSL